MSAVTSDASSAHVPTDSTQSDHPRGVLARFFNPLRLASYLLGLYALGHTSGAVLKTPRFGAQSDAVVAAMKTVHVRAQGADCTWYGFYRGFGLLVTVFFVFSAVLTWHLGGSDGRSRRAFAPITTALFLSYAASVVLTWAYFFSAPSVFSMAITALLGWACVQDVRSGQSESTHARG